MPSPADPPRPGLAEPAVSAEAYDREYYLEANMGADVWAQSGGAEVAGTYEAVLGMAGLREGWAVLDVGCGRGELVRVALEQGAGRAAGIDYSEAAVEMGRETLAHSELGAAAELVQGDARALPFEDEQFDLVTMLDVVEHLTPDELAAALAEARRVLRPGGTLFVHTAPNRWVYDLTYRLQRALLPWRLVRWPADPRNDYERQMHVNEQSRGSLRAALTDAGFSAVNVELGGWVYTGHLRGRAGRLNRTLARLGPARALVAMDLFARGSK